MNKEHVFSFIVQCALGNHNPFDILSQGFLRGAFLAPSEEASKADLLTLTYGLASLAFENEEDQEWLIWRFAMLDDILLETRAFQEIRKSALKEGREEGREEGKLEGLREALLTLVQARFPGRKLQRLTKIQAVLIDDPTILEDLITKIALAQTLEEVQTILLDVPDTDEE